MSATVATSRFYQDGSAHKPSCSRLFAGRSSALRNAEGPRGNAGLQRVGRADQSGRRDSNSGPLVPQTSALTRLRHAPRLAEYYTKLFGEPGWGGGGYTGWQVGSSTVTVGPHDQVHGANTEPGRIIWNIESTDVQGDFDRLKAAGATVIREPYTMEGAPDMPSPMIATLADPDGNYFQLVTPMM